MVQCLGLICAFVPRKDGRKISRMLKDKRQELVAIAAVKQYIRKSESVADAVDVIDDDCSFLDYGDYSEDSNDDMHLL